jgi:undecaprenyl-diphosphatase
MATLLAVFLYFFRDIFSLLAVWLYGFFNRNARRWVGWRFGWAVVVGSFVTASIGILLKNTAERAASNMLWLGVNFLLTGLILLSSRFLRAGDGAVQTRSGILVGLLQGVAVFPGVSRSGATIWGGLLSGLSREEAFRFSFLLSAPAIVGASCYEARDLGGFGEFMGSLPAGWLPASVVAFISGLISLILLRRLVTSDKWWAFSLYCIALGCLVVVYAAIGA